jgi:catechol 2,3-dioxygenase
MKPPTLPPDTHIGCIELKISDLNRSLDFYSDLLGFQIVEREANRAALSPSSSAGPLIILSAIRNAQRKPPRTTGLYHVAIRIPERPALGALLRRLLEHRYPLQGAADHLVSEAVYLADPDGNGLELYIDHPRDTWPRMDGQVAMATDPLDADGLLREANQNWNGIHPKTDIGHVHLHVSDLSQAEDFYCGLLGFEVTQRSYPGALFVSAGGYHHHLGLNVWAGHGAPPPPPAAVGLELFQVIIPDEADRQNVINRLAEAGVDISSRSDSAVRFHDPHGNQIEL